MLTRALIDNNYVFYCNLYYNRIDGKYICYLPMTVVHTLLSDSLTMKTSFQLNKLFLSNICLRRKLFFFSYALCKSWMNNFRDIFKRNPSRNLWRNPERIVAEFIQITSESLSRGITGIMLRKKPQKTTFKESREK